MQLFFGLPLLAGLTLLGAYLLVGGWRGRRVGYEPRCGRCEYDLTLLESARCPECGLELGPETVVQGVRRRGRVALAAGAILALSGALSLAALGYLAVQRTDFYRMYPFSMVLDDARSRSAQGMNELDRRVRAATLSSWQMRTLADVCLEFHEQKAAPANLWRWLDWLEALDVNGQLNDERRQRYYKGMMICTLEARPEVGLGDCLPVRVTCTSRVPIDGTIRTTFTWEKLRIGDWSQLYDGGSGGQLGMGGTTQSFCPSVDLPLGKHKVEFTLNYEIVRGTVVLRSERVTLVAETTVVPADEVMEPVRVDDPALGAQMRADFVIENTHIVEAKRMVRHRDKPLAEETYWTLRFVLRATAPLPVNVAFDVIVRLGDEEVSGGTMSLAEGATTGVHFDVEVPHGDFFDAFTVILRSRPDLVRNSVDLFEYWEGEIILGPVPITPGQPNNVWSPPSPARSATPVPTPASAPTGR